MKPVEKAIYELSTAIHALACSVGKTDRGSVYLSQDNLDRAKEMAAEAIKVLESKEDAPQSFEVKVDPRTWETISHCFVDAPGPMPVKEKDLEEPAFEPRECTFFAHRMKLDYSYEPLTRTSQTEMDGKLTAVQNKVEPKIKKAMGAYPYYQITIGDWQLTESTDWQKLDKVFTILKAIEKTNDVLAGPKRDVFDSLVTISKDLAVHVSDAMYHIANATIKHEKVSDEAPTCPYTITEEGPYESESQTVSSIDNLEDYLRTKDYTYDIPIDAILKVCAQVNFSHTAFHYRDRKITIKFGGKRHPAHPWCACNGSEDKCPHGTCPPKPKGWDEEPLPVFELSVEREHGITLIGVIVGAQEVQDYIRQMFHINPDALQNRLNALRVGEKRDFNVKDGILHIRRKD